MKCIQICKSDEDIEVTYDSKSTEKDDIDSLSKYFMGNNGVDKLTIVEDQINNKVQIINNSTKDQNKITIWEYERQKIRALELEKIEVEVEEEEYDSEMEEGGEEQKL